MLNNPYYCYPGFPCAGLFDMELSNREMLRCHQYIVELRATINKKTFMNINIGTGAEEYYVETHNLENIKFQWQQLFPEHLQRKAREDPSFPIINIIISPSAMFYRGHIPVFISKTPEFNWYSEEPNTYRSRSHNIIVKIFNCPLPSKFDYEPVLARIRDSGMMSDGEFIASHIQTEEDKNFINKFYRDLGELFNTVNRYLGFVTCLSSAVFNTETHKARYNNYYLFKELTNLFHHNHVISNRLLAEWIYRPLCYTMNIYNHSGENKFFTYCNIESLRPFITGEASIPFLSIRENISIQEIIIRDNTRRAENKKIVKHHKNKESDKDNYSIYDCLINNCLIKKLTVEELRQKVVKEITSNNKEDDIINYILGNEHMKKIRNKIDNNKYQICNYYLKLISSDKPELRSYFEIPEDCSLFDSLEIKYLTNITKIGITVKDTYGNILYPCDGVYEQKIVLIYDVITCKYYLKEAEKQDLNV